MTRLLILFVLFWPFSAFGEVDGTVIQKIVTTELSALKMPGDFPFLLGDITIRQYFSNWG